MSQPYILIRNGLIIDGTGSEPFAGDVLIQNNRIVALGPDAATQWPAGAEIQELDVKDQRLK